MLNFINLDALKFVDKCDLVKKNVILRNICILVKVFFVSTQKTRICFLQSSFLCKININVKYNKIINTLARSTKNIKHWKISLNVAFCHRGSISPTDSPDPSSDCERAERGWFAQVRVWWEAGANKSNPQIHRHHHPVSVWYYKTFQWLI